jgi:hypothetical protein
MNVATDGFIEKTIANEQETIKPTTSCRVQTLHVKTRANYINAIGIIE